MHVPIFGKKLSNSAEFGDDEENKVAQEGPMYIYNDFHTSGAIYA